MQIKIRDQSSQKAPDILKNQCVRQTQSPHRTWGKDMEKDFNSSENQKIKGDFVGREVFCCVTNMVEYIIKKSFEDSSAPFSFEDTEIERYSYDGKFVSFDSLTFNKKCDLENSIEHIIEAIEENEDGCWEVLESDEEASFLKVGVYTKFELEDLEEDYRNICDGLDPNWVEIYEWWAVSRNLNEWLTERGEVMLDDGQCYIWGRQSTGQAILLDYVISEICDDLGLLK